MICCAAETRVVFSCNARLDGLAEVRDLVGPFLAYLLHKPWLCLNEIQLLVPHAHPAVRMYVEF
jgi:hypothetical protein